MTMGIKDTPGQYLNLGQILPTKKLIRMYLTRAVIKAKKPRTEWLLLPLKRKTIPN